VPHEYSDLRVARHKDVAGATGSHPLVHVVEYLYISTITIEAVTVHLNIKNDEAHELATELARLTGENLTSAVTVALRERLARERRRRRSDDIAARLMKIGKRYAALSDTGRSPDEILGYDEHGLPT
jgi:antitoxin VapB